MYKLTFILIRKLIPDAFLFYTEADVDKRRSALQLLHV